MFSLRTGSNSAWGFACGFMLLLLPAAGRAQVGGAYDLHWNLLDCGGGNVVGGALSLFVAVAQPLAGSASGGLYTLSAGFLQQSGFNPAAVGSGAHAPLVFDLTGAAPNPTPGTCTISYELPPVQSIHLGVYDAGGRLVRALASAPSSAGRHVVNWDGKDEAGSPVGSGLYLVRLNTDRGEKTEKLVVLR